MRIVLALLAAGLLTGCGESLDWWESTAAGDRLFLLNKRTGELYTVQGGEVRPVEQNLTVAWEGPTEPVDHELKARRHSLSRNLWMFDDVVKIDIETKYRNGEVEVMGDISPHMKNVNDMYAGSLVFTLLFLDSSGFTIAEAALNRSDLVTSVGEDGKPVRHAFTKRVAVGPEDWAEAAFFNASWSNQTDAAIAAWKKANPNDTKTRQELARAEKDERMARFWELVDREAEAAGQRDVAAPPPESTPVNGEKE